MAPKLSFALVFLFAIVKPSVQAATYCDNNCQPPAVNGGYYCVLTDPTKFTVCSNGQRYEKSCGSGLVWDSASNNCNWPASSTPCSCNGQSATVASSTTTTTTTTNKPASSSQSSQTATTTKASGQATTTTQSGQSQPSNAAVVCYYTNWAQYRKGSASFTPDNIDASLCTHINYAFLNFDSKSITLREWNDDVMIPKVLALKSKNANLKVIASIGGWNAGTASFSQIIASSTVRSQFNQAAITFLRKYKFDGLDVDFEYPGAADRGSSASDKPLFTEWMKSLAADFASEASKTGNTRLLLTAAIAAGEANINNGYDIPAISQSLDLINVMTYDFHGAWDSITGYNAPLNKLPSWSAGSDLDKFTAAYSINYLLSLGAPPSKLVMGIPLYGRSFTLANSNNNGIGAAAIGAGLVGAYTGEAGFNAYYETCMLSKCSTTPYTFKYDNDLQGPYMYSSRNWISTENVDSVAAKVKFANDKKLGGIMFWAIDLDDFNDMCNNGVKFPLMKTAINTLKGVAAPTLNSATSSTMCSAVIG